MLGQRSRQSMLMDWFVLHIFDSLFGEVLFGEVSERTVRVFRCVLIFPWLVGLVVLLVEDSFELVLA